MTLNESGPRIAARTLVLVTPIAPALAPYTSYVDGGDQLTAPVRPAPATDAPVGVAPGGAAPGVAAPAAAPPPRLR